MTAAGEFVSSYDLCGNGLLYREQKHRENVEVLTKELALLKDG